MRSARPDSPENWSAPWIVFDPTVWPSSAARKTKASQPQIATFR
jgi:hypothetical protein